MENGKWKTENGISNREVRTSRRTFWDSGFGIRISGSFVSYPRKPNTESRIPHFFLHGQSLIELLLAMTVIMVGLSAAGTLVFSNIRLQERSADRVTAANLARGGVELAKAQRDSNWLAGVAFNAGMFSGLDYTGVPIMNDGRFVSFDFTADGIDEASWTVLKRSTKASSAGMFVQGPAQPGTDTIFRRIITFQPVCSDGSVRNEGLACAPLATVGVRVTSRVAWDKRGKRRESVIVDDLYDWR
jgi:Tfp pilus assembly protein PilV